MKNVTSYSRLALAKIAIAGLGLAFCVAFVQVPNASAADDAAAHKSSEKAASSVLSPKFEKVAEGENGPYLLHLTNTSKESVKASGKVLLSVAFHNQSKARILSEQVVEAGKVWTIPGLAAGDKVIINISGQAPLELTVP